MKYKILSGAAKQVEDELNALVSIHEDVEILSMSATDNTTTLLVCINLQLDISQKEVLKNLDKVTRVEVIRGSTRAFTKLNIKGEVSASLQDNERTLKIFIKEYTKKKDSLPFPEWGKYGGGSPIYRGCPSRGEPCFCSGVCKEVIGYK